WFEFAQHIYTMIGADTRLVSPIDTENYPTKAKRPSYSVLSHSRTVAQGIGEMRHWKIALEASKDAMRDQIRNEGH
ncbi:MAG: dTDP-4-dehydrorhamnose reductase, partial [Actinobacteria bacterium]|nr:dTDP-4-dehydrorhamnose reductase [Actinomycetota bacterium]